MVEVSGQSAFHDGSADLEALPVVPPGFAVTVFAREPLVQQTCAMAFDGRGRLFVGMGPQYRNPRSDTPADSVVMVLDTDADGTADTTRVFATGFNCVQGMAWRGRDLWVANAPDLTIVRDIDGDDIADEYVKVYSDLGNLEHGLHGLNWAPDGRLYMSKGNSKGLNSPDRYAPKVFRDLWGMPSPAGALDLPPPATFTPEAYQRTYHDPADDWGREGGIIRCERGGENPEIVSRGFRNPWDIGFDDGFDWLGTDNDQTDGDRVFRPFHGAHFGWNHPWAAGWTSVDEPHVAPVCGPIFDGSGTGVTFGNSPQFPPEYRGVWFINDWLQKTTYVFRPQWDGATMGPQAGSWEPFVTGASSLFRPVDLEFGPDGALWCLGWSRGYGAEFVDGRMTNEGRIYRIAWNRAAPMASIPVAPGPDLKEWSLDELWAAFAGPLASRRIDVQDEWLRRGPSARPHLTAALASHSLARAQETWAAWTLGRFPPEDRTIDSAFIGWLGQAAASLNLRIQSLRILADRAAARSDTGSLEWVTQFLHNPEPRLRFEAVQAAVYAHQDSASPALIERLAAETDRTIFYAAWQAMRRLISTEEIHQLLAHPAEGVRAGAVLALLEDGRLNRGEVAPLAEDSGPRVREIARLWLQETTHEAAAPVVRGRPLGAPTTAPLSLVPVPAGVADTIVARSGGHYELAPGGLRAGAVHFTDRPFQLREVPAELDGCDYIRTPNNDDSSSGEEFLMFDALLPVRVHIAHDTRVRYQPGWLQNGWTAGETMAADHWTYRLYHRDFPAGRIVLGGNTTDGTARGHSHYIVILQTLPLAAPEHITTAEDILAKLPSADPRRGAALFHQHGAAGCSVCHRLHGHGNAFGPDLASLGARADARHIVQSMIDPHAVITEGFQLVTIETADANYSGMLIEESGVAVTLGLPSGQRQRVAKPDIVSRVTAPVSAMPAYAAALGASELADITVWLMQQTAAAPATTSAVAGPHTPPPAPAPATPPSAQPIAWPAGKGFQYSQHADRLVIAYDSQPVGHFVFRDPHILRPYIAHAHAPDGIQVTRTHPPVEGQDATDHADMHPGLWLGFGSLNGHDFWRHKASIDHEQFIDQPSVSDGRLQFSTVSRLLAPDRQSIGRMVSRISLHRVPGAHLVIWESTFSADQGDLVFGDQEEMGFGARLATALTEKNGGRLVSSTGARTAKTTWGQPADWCDYSGQIDGRHCGITLMASPSNFRPSWWHNRDYGVFVANPFGRAAMRQGAPSSVTVAAGQSVTFRFGAALHTSTNASPPDPAQLYQSFLATTPATTAPTSPAPTSPADPQR